MGPIIIFMLFCVTNLSFSHTPERDSQSNREESYAKRYTQYREKVQQSGRKIESDFLNSSTEQDSSIRDHVTYRYQLNVFVPIGGVKDHDLVVNLANHNLQIDFTDLKYDHFISQMGDQIKKGQGRWALNLELQASEQYWALTRHHFNSLKKFNRSLADQGLIDEKALKTLDEAMDEYKLQSEIQQIVLKIGYIFGIAKEHRFHAQVGKSRIEGAPGTFANTQGPISANVVGRAAGGLNAPNVSLGYAYIDRVKSGEDINGDQVVDSNDNIPVIARAEIVWFKNRFPYINSQDTALRMGTFTQRQLDEFKERFDLNSVMYKGSLMYNRLLLSSSLTHHDGEGISAAVSALYFIDQQRRHAVGGGFWHGPKERGVGTESLGLGYTYSGGEHHPLTEVPGPWYSFWAGPGVIKGIEFPFTPDADDKDITVFSSGASCNLFELRNDQSRSYLICTTKYQLDFGNFEESGVQDVHYIGGGIELNW